MDYSQLSDFEINKRVSDVFWPGMTKSAECNNKNFPQNSSIVYMNNGYGGFSRDYCNNPADAWPIIVKNKIWIREMCGIWDSKGFPDEGHPFNQVGWKDKNPLRAAMIVFLMMQDKS